MRAWIMALELRQQLKLSQQLVMTPQLQQAIKLLQLSRLELLESVQQELMENPLLEETVEEDRSTERTMLIKILGSRTKALEALAVEAKQAGCQGIVVAGEVLRKRVAEG